jgi:hypothetical protein
VPIGVVDNVAFAYDIPQAQPDNTVKSFQQIVPITPYSVATLIVPVTAAAGFAQLIDIIVPFGMFITEIDILPIGATSTTATQFYVKYGLNSLGNSGAPISAFYAINVEFKAPYLPMLALNDHITLFAHASATGSSLQMLIIGFQAT